MKGLGVAVCVLSGMVFSFASAAPAGAAPKGFLGVVPSTVPPSSDYPRMADAGVSTVRILISWPAVQPVEGEPYDWAAIDRQVADAAASGITTVPFFYGTPAWATDCSGFGSIEVCERSLPLRTGYAQQGWSALLHAAQERYGPGGTFWRVDGPNAGIPYLPIRTWQIWNEENFVEFTRPSPSVGGYYKLLQISRAALDRDPGGRIMIGGLFRPAAPFLSRLYAIPGAKNLFDIVAVHPYRNSQRKLREELTATRRVMDKHRDRGSPIQLTELGWGSAPRGGSQRIPLSGLFVGRRGQALALRAVLKALLAERNKLGLQAVFWFAWKDQSASTAGSCALCESAGLLDADGSPKPALAAFARVARGR